MTTQPIDVQRQLTDLLTRHNRVEVAAVALLESGTVRVVFTDGSAIFTSVCHVENAGKKPPAGPGWPMQHLWAGARRPAGSPARTGGEPPAGGGSMHPGYFAGFAGHLLRRAGLAVATFTEVGAVGFNWPPCGLRVTAGGQAVYLSFARTAPPSGDVAPLATRFDPEAPMSQCPVRSARTSAERGQPTPEHQPQGSRERCPGSGQPSV